MVYVELTFVVPRDKVQEALDGYQRILPWDKECFEKVGGKLIGCWYTRYGRLGEITTMLAYPNLDAREKAIQMFTEGAKRHKEVTDWWALTPSVTVRVLLPATYSPLQ